MRLIDADEFRYEWLENGENEYVYDTNAVLDSIDAQPTIDATPVVRCKDCVHENMTTCPLCWIENHTMHFINHNSDDFCSCGERRSNG